MGELKIRDTMNNTYSKRQSEGSRHQSRHRHKSYSNNTKESSDDGYFSSRVTTSLVRDDEDVDDDDDGKNKNTNTNTSNSNNRNHVRTSCNRDFSDDDDDVPKWIDPKARTSTIGDNHGDCDHNVYIRDELDHRSTVSGTSSISSNSFSSSSSSCCDSDNSSRIVNDYDDDYDDAKETKETKNVESTIRNRSQEQQQSNRGSILRSSSRGKLLRRLPTEETKQKSPPSSSRRSAPVRSKSVENVSTVKTSPDVENISTVKTSPACVAQSVTASAATIGSVDGTTTHNVRRGILRTKSADNGLIGSASNHSDISTRTGGRRAVDPRLLRRQVSERRLGRKRDSLRRFDTSHDNESVDTNENRSNPPGDDQIINPTYAGTTLMKEIDEEKFDGSTDSSEPKTVTSSSSRRLGLSRSSSHDRLVGSGLQRTGSIRRIGTGINSTSASVKSPAKNKSTLLQLSTVTQVKSPGAGVSSGSGSSHHRRTSGSLHRRSSGGGIVRGSSSKSITEANNGSEHRGEGKIDSHKGNEKNGSGAASATANDNDDDEDDDEKEDKNELEAVVSVVSKSFSLSSSSRHSRTKSPSGVAATHIESSSNRRRSSGGSGTSGSRRSFRVQRVSSKPLVSSLLGNHDTSSKDDDENDDNNDNGKNDDEIDPKSSSRCETTTGSKSPNGKERRRSSNGTKGRRSSGSRFDSSTTTTDSHNMNSVILVRKRSSRHCTSSKASSTRGDHNSAHDDKNEKNEKNENNVDSNGGPDGTSATLRRVKVLVRSNSMGRSSHHASTEDGSGNNIKSGGTNLRRSSHSTNKVSDATRRTFFDIIDLNPSQAVVWSNETTKVLLQLMKQHPHLCSTPYTTFRAFPDEPILPIHIFCALGAPIPIVRQCLRAYPNALNDNTTSKYGTPFHFVCMFHHFHNANNSSTVHPDDDNNHDEDLNGNSTPQTTANNTLLLLKYLVKTRASGLVVHNQMNEQTTLHLACMAHHHESLSSNTAATVRTSSREFVSLDGSAEDAAGATTTTTKTATNSNDERYAEIVNYILQVCPKLATVLDKDKNTPLHVACATVQNPASISTAIVKRLLVSLSSSSTTAPSSSSQPPAAGQSLNETLCIASCVAQNVSGATALHLALYNKAPKSLIELLIRANPNSLRVHDNKQRLPIHIAVAVKNQDCDFYKSLIQYYPESVNHRNNHDETPYELAVSKNLNMSILDILMSTDGLDYYDDNNNSYEPRMNENNDDNNKHGSNMYQHDDDDDYDDGSFDSVDDD